MGITESNTNTMLCSNFIEVFMLLSVMPMGSHAIATNKKDKIKSLFIVIGYIDSISITEQGQNVHSETLSLISVLKLRQPPRELTLTQPLVIVVQHVLVVS